MNVMKYAYGLLGLALFLLPLSASAATSFEVTGWIPYWRTATGTADVLPHLADLTEVNPFVYTIKSDGTFLDNGSLDTEPWLSFIAAAKAQKVRVIPTIMTGNSDLLHELLSNTTKRIALEDRIAKLVKDNNFDGIDIDFEGKKAADKDYFSTFLKGLYARMGKKWVMCTIESRTPVESRYYGVDIPPDATIYANDFVAINKYCDRVRIMAYDQQSVDLKLADVASSTGELYAPVGDPAWVEKVVNLAAKSISKNKILIGVPTYGYEYDVTAYAGKEYTYKILWTFNPGYASTTAAQYGVVPARNSSGEMQFTYFPTVSSTTPTSSTPPVSSNLISALTTANAATAYADALNSHQTFRLIDWPDAQSIAGKIALAKKLGVRGISIFKLDGGEDPNIWNVLAGVTRSAVSAPTASVSSSGALTRALDIGTTGEDVRTLQKILNSNSATRVAASGGGSLGNETTTFGPATANAVQRFQVKYGIAKLGDAGYGYVGPMTRAKLNSILSSL